MEKKQEVYALEVLRETLQRFYDVVYPFDEAIGCRDLPTLAPNDIDSLRFSMDDFTDATPDFGNVCDAAVQLLARSDREELRRRLAELKGAIIDFGRAHKAMIAAGKTEYAARCDEANAAYARIRDLAEAALGVVDGLLTKIDADAATNGTTAKAAADAPMVANPAPSKKKRSNRRAFPQESMATVCGVTVRTIKNWESGETPSPTAYDSGTRSFIPYSPSLRDDPTRARTWGMSYKFGKENAKDLREKNIR